jgi:Heme/copper-type cytochrome/quinol oxidases, subunit 1
LMNFIFTMWRGSMTFESPMLFGIAIILMFSFAGVTGVMLAVVPADMQYHDTMFVVAHFHYALIPGAVFGLYAGVFYWLPKWTGHMYNERLGQIFFWWTTISFNLTFFPQHFSGLAGMPRRIVDYSIQYTEFNMISSIGGFLFGLSHLLFLFHHYSDDSRRGKSTSETVGRFTNRYTGIGMDTAFTATVPQFYRSTGD